MDGDAVQRRHGYRIDVLQRRRTHVLLRRGPPFFAGSAQAGTAAAAGPALAQTFFHWGLHPWAVYALVGLGLAFFSFNRGLPLTFRSIFWPVLGERIYGWPGHVIDLLSVFATLFGLSTSLGFGVAQVNQGLNVVAGSLFGASVPVGTVPQVVLIGGITLIATASVAAGLDSGVKRLSTINLYLMFIMLGFLILVGPTLYIFNAFVGGLGTYLVSLPGLSLFTGAFAGQPAKEFLGSWTIFYWGWWISWSPFVGMFIARISKGRTVREFVVGVLVLPSLFSFLWLATSAAARSRPRAAVRASSPRSRIRARPSRCSRCSPSTRWGPLVDPRHAGRELFFVTSSDSGSLVMDHLTSGGKHNVHELSGSSGRSRKASSRRCCSTPAVSARSRPPRSPRGSRSRSSSS